jgi:predicted anti-sigma-YlaC factor YlaD
MYKEETMKIHKSIIERFYGSFSIAVSLFLLIFLVVTWCNEAVGKTLHYPLSLEVTLLNHALTGTKMFVLEKKFARYH